jgi:rod shape-determining protein MreC
MERATDYTLGMIFRYDEYRRDNESLRQEVANLKKTVLSRAEIAEENKRLHRMLDFVRDEPRLKLEPVRVIESYKGMLRIDRGAVHGIKQFMCVLNEAGVVGIVTDVNDFTSTVATLHHPDCKVGAMVLRNRLRAYDGVIHASGSDLSRICTMEYIDMKDDVRVGDLVVTSPESLFPAGYLIGTVSAWHASGSLWKTADITPAVDPYRLDEVFVVIKAKTSEDELTTPEKEPEPLPEPSLAPESSAGAKAAATTAPEMPDNRPIQERYAP